MEYDPLLLEIADYVDGYHVEREAAVEHNFDGIHVCASRRVAVGLGVARLLAYLHKRAQVVDARVRSGVVRGVAERPGLVFPPP